MASPSDACPVPSAAEIRRAAFSGLAANLIGIGLARFGYTPLLPALVSARWFTESAAAYLGAANFAGYLAGALVARALIRRIATATVLRAMMALVAASLFACALRDLGFAWFFLWRLASGLAGGVIMVLAAPAVLVATPVARRGWVGGIIFTGVGLGVAASGTLVPLLLRLGGLVGAWVGLGALALLLTAYGWSGWPAFAAVPHPAAGARPNARALGPVGLLVTALLAEYALNAVGLVPHMLFLVAYVARGLDRGLDAGAAYWVLYGIGALAGPLVAGRLGDRIGFAAALRLALLVEAVAVALPAISTDARSLALSSLIAGAMTPGIVPIALGRIHELVPDAALQGRCWSHATTAWALAQALAGYACARALTTAGSYALLFSLGACALLAALFLELATSVRRPVASARSAD
ncbi:MAG TPA: YbfB/YjiJ family MFS transporter [Stellaceae bacterium]|nr:YbfB/YjiJ family MFS transporter [Stellaceae bacterium]